MLIEVTKEDIKSGKRGICLECPISLAITRASGLSAVVGTREVLLGDYDDVGSALPPKATDFIHRFDSGHRVVPFTFELEIPDAD